MNRWGRWARQIRTRYGRRAGHHASGAMELARAGRVYLRAAAPTRSIAVTLHAPSWLRWGPQMWVTLRGAGDRRASGGSARPGWAGRPMVDRARARREVFLGGRAGTADGSAVAGHVGAAAEPSTDRRLAWAPRATLSSGDRAGVRFDELIRRRVLECNGAAASAQLLLRVRARSERVDLAQAARPDLVFSAPQRPRGDDSVTRGRAERLSAAAHELGAAASRPSAPSINFEALTSEVIQRLDRRLVAYRERMGRV